jgi:nitrogen fixation NifU-like protein
MMDPRAFFEDMILDHNRNPRNFQKRPAGLTHHAHGFNPVCNDEFRVQLRVEDGVIRDIGFEGAGCAISTASASMMTEAVRGKSVAEARRLFNDMHRLLIDAAPVEGLGKLAILSGVHEYPMRVKCATLAWHVLNAALENRPEMVSTEDDGPPPPVECAVDDKRG